MIHEPIALIVIDMQGGIKGPDAVASNKAGTAIYKIREASAITEGSA